MSPQKILPIGAAPIVEINSLILSTLNKFVVHFFSINDLRYRLVLIIILFFLSINNGFTQSSPFATLIEINHVCGEELGSATFELNGDPDNYTYYWEHGPTTLSIENLLPGTYYFIVTDKFGCVERFEIEILQYDECTSEYFVFPTYNPCQALIQIIVYSGGAPVNESALNIVWSDGNPSGLNRLVSLTQSNIYCVTITSSQVVDCCELNICIPIQANPDCRYKDQVIVNEFIRRGNGNGQYVELLVLGSGECGDYFDLRGFHVDDNNGLLINGNEFINNTNYSNIGVNPGFLTFSHHDGWSNVPNGSLILIYSGIQDYSEYGNMPSYDPEDDNEDFVYVVNAEDVDYFIANTGSWNNITGSLDYDGGFVTIPAWSLIDISTGADGMQVRNPDGSHSHGISLGMTAFSEVNTFPLWLTNNSSTDCNCSLILTDYLNKDHFECGLSTDGLHTPGQPNSDANATMIADLVECLDERNFRQTDELDEGTSTYTEELAIYPNPFNQSFNLLFSSPIQGSAKVDIYSVSGRFLYSQSFHTETEISTLLLKPTVELPNGVLLLRFLCPSGKILRERIICVDSR